jgi:hypothetical protein
MATTQLSVPPATGSRTLERVTGITGLATVVILMGTSLANGYEQPSMISSGAQSATYLRSLDNSFASFSYFLTVLALLTWAWFAVGLALLLRRVEGDPAWLSAFTAVAGILVSVPSQVATWDAAPLGGRHLDPQVARYAFNLGSLSFANTWVATGAVAICASLVIRRKGILPSWVAWLGLIAGTGLVLARAAWTQPLAYLPFGLVWLWVLIVSFALLTGRHRPLTVSTS